VAAASSTHASSFRIMNLSRRLSSAELHHDRATVRSGAARASPALALAVLSSERCPSLSRKQTAVRRSPLAISIPLPKHERRGSQDESLLLHLTRLALHIAELSLESGKLCVEASKLRPPRALVSIPHQLVLPFAISPSGASVGLAYA